MQHQDLWDCLLNFEFDNPKENYGFTLRLATENKWTLNFTKGAILEYKKFMYLAAISSRMVSPSQAVDEVWHMHLLFSKSYSKLCLYLGKTIEHIPSTHNHSEKQTFTNARNLTKELYELHFGKQPELYWNYQNPLDSLQLKPAKIAIINLKQYTVAGVVVAVVLSFFLLKYTSTNISGSAFIGLTLIAGMASIIYTEVYIKQLLVKFCKKIMESEYLRNLNGFELIFLSYNNLNPVLDTVLNSLVNKGIIEIKNKSELRLVTDEPTDNDYENAVIEILTAKKAEGKEYIKYEILKLTLNTSKRFYQIKRAGESIKETIENSKTYFYLLLKIYAVCGVVASLIGGRIILGMSREKPVFFLVAILILYSVYFIKSSMIAGNRIFANYITDEYKRYILEGDDQHQLEWSFLLLGSAIFTPDFLVMNKRLTKDNSSWLNKSNDTYNSCVSSNHSSCGSSCGGGGGGCGGCGGD